MWVGEPKIEAQDPSSKRKVRGREKGRVRCGFDVGPRRQEGKKSGSDDDDLSQPGRCVCQAMQGLGVLRRGMFNSIERSYLSHLVLAFDPFQRSRITAQRLPEGTRERGYFGVGSVYVVCVQRKAHGCVCVAVWQLIERPK